MSMLRFRASAAVSHSTGAPHSLQWVRMTWASGTLKTAVRRRRDLWRLRFPMSEVWQGVVTPVWFVCSHCGAAPLTGGESNTNENDALAQGAKRQTNDHRAFNAIAG